MKLTENWHGKKPPPKPKRVSPKPKIPWQLLGLPDPAEKQKPLSMDEVRRQVSLIVRPWVWRGSAIEPKHAKRQRGWQKCTSKTPSWSN